MKRLLAGIAVLLMAALGKVLNRSDKRMRAVGSMISFGTSDKVQAEAE